MPRARNIKPGFFTNADLIECQPLARLLFAGLWCEADRRGILEDRPNTLKIKILPGDNCDVDVLLDELMSRQFIQRYEASGVRCILIVNFPKHQNPHRDEKENTLPTPCQHSAPTVPTPEQHPTSPADSLLLIDDRGLRIADSEEGANAPQTQTSPVRSTPKPQAQTVPDDFIVTDDMRRQAEGYGVPVAEIDRETEKFRDHFKAHGKKMTDWPAAWRNWMRRVSEFAPKQTNGAGGTFGPKGPDAAWFAQQARDLERQGR